MKEFLLTNLPIFEIDGINTVATCALSNPLAERLIGTTRRGPPNGALLLPALRARLPRELSGSW
jgi:hypothetical protein